MGTFADYIEISNHFKNNLWYNHPNKKPEPYYTDVFLKEISSIINLDDRQRSLIPHLKKDSRKSRWSHYVYNDLKKYVLKLGLFRKDVSINLMNEWEPQLEYIAKEYRWINKNNLEKKLKKSLKKYDDPILNWSKYKQWRKFIKQMAEYHRMDELYSMQAGWKDQKDSVLENTDLFLTEVMYDKKRWF